MSESVTLPKSLDFWSFSTKTYKGTCRLAKDATSVVAEFTVDNGTEFPDVCDIESWFEETVTGGEWTAEELAVECVRHTGLTVKLLMTAASHGPIEVVCSP